MKRKYLAIALVVLIACGAAAAAIGYGLTRGGGGNHEHHYITQADAPVPLTYKNTDGAAPLCKPDFARTGEICNTDENMVSLSLMLLNEGGSEALNNGFYNEMLNSCISLGRGQLPCSYYINGSVVQILLYNLIHGIPQLS